MRSTLRFLLPACLLAAAATAAPPPQVDDTLAEEDVQAIIAVATEADRHWDAGDAAALGRTFTEDAHLHIAGTPVRLSGRTAIEAYFARSFARREGVLRHRTSVDAVHALADDQVVADLHVWLERVEPDGSVTPLRFFVSTAITERRADGWATRVLRTHAHAPADGSAFEASLAPPSPTRMAPAVAAR